MATGNLIPPFCKETVKLISLVHANQSHIEQEDQFNMRLFPVSLKIQQPPADSF